MSRRHGLATLETVGLETQAPLEVAPQETTACPPKISSTCWTPSKETNSKEAPLARREASVPGLATQTVR